MRTGDEDLISQRRREIAAEIGRLQKEDRELKSAQEVLERLLGRAGAPATGSGPQRRRIKPLSLRHFVLDALAHDPKVWLRVGEVCAYAQEAWDEKISVSSLRPLLTKMKHSGAIVRHGRLIAAKERARERSPESAQRRD